MKNKIIDSLKNFGDKQVLILGDYCLDEYHQGDAHSLAPEAPIPRVVVEKGWTLIGQSGNVAMGVRALGAKTFAMGIIGKDSASQKLMLNLNEAGIDTTGMILQSDRITSRFSRIIVGGNHYPKQHAIRFDFENKKDVLDENKEKIIQFVKEKAHELNAIIIADYDEVGKGIINKKLLDKITKIAKEYGIILIGDSRKNFTMFNDFDYLVPNVFEAQQAYGKLISNDQDILLAAKYLIDKLSLKGILITRGQNGIDVFENMQGNLKRTNIPVVKSDVVDVTGAGDSVTCAYTLCLCAGLSPVESAMTASLGASVTVLKEGVVAVKAEEIERVALRLSDHDD